MPLERETVRGMKMEAYCNCVAERVGRQRIRINALQAHDRHCSREKTDAENDCERNLLLQRPSGTIQGLDGECQNPKIRDDVDT